VLQRPGAVFYLNEQAKGPSLYSIFSLCPGSLQNSSARSPTFRSLPKSPVCPQGLSAPWAEHRAGELLRQWVPPPKPLEQGLPLNPTDLPGL